MAIGVPDSNLSQTSGGYAYLVMGASGATRSGIAMSSLSASDGFAITGGATGEKVGSMVEISGDLNGDGYDDLVVVGSRTDDGATSAGNIYVIWGNSSPSTINLATDFNRTPGFTNSKGFLMTGYESSDEIGMYDYLVSPNNAQFLDASGDFNGDGIQDLLIGHEQSDEQGTNAGYVYLIFGKSGATRFNFSLNNYISQGLRMYHATSSAYVGHSVQFIGDYNGDHLTDVLIGAPGQSSDDGEAYVVFGYSTSTYFDINLANLDGSNGFTISTSDTNALLGGATAAADVNGDGLTDIIVGVPEGNYGGHSTNGAAMVIYGSSGPHADLTLEALPAGRGYVIYGEDDNDQASYSVQGIQDINGDGVDDIVLSSGLDANAGNDAGAAWVIFGKTGTSRANIDLSTLSANDGFKILGDTAGDRFGQSATSGDLNGDGYRDLMVSSVAGDNAGSFAGEVNVIWGRDFWAVVDLSQTGTSGADNLVGTDGADTLIGNGGADSFSAGAGDDFIELSDTGFFKIDGGRGTDTIRFTTSLNTLNISTLGLEKISNVEIIDLADNGNVLQVSENSVLGMSGESKILYIKGGSSDAVVSSIGDTWVYVTNNTVGGVTYRVFRDSDTTGPDLYIQSGIDDSAVP
ncbi:MAG: hypothetical protein CML06_19440 [Pseudomonadales bacterium]|nr:hypothetical protein [Pseudomonadales bacterium]